MNTTSQILLDLLLPCNVIVREEAPEVQPIAHVAEQQGLSVAEARLVNISLVARQINAGRC